ncbi:flavin monoamine oxidase family protein [Corallococcus silvisoli]|uniref:flavin monoamine oxidase family protein n=1 Tax=Corallococcus silvisoli TaxID=2697031 RepID=UPI001378CE9C|nr:FAD-dependent oxidoreductase [Corallococcus silvisoli]NBD08813.1 NAD(P)-binding protein [Corallococcus silvisoli]
MEVAIVGAGVGGCYLGYRLTHDGSPRLRGRVGLYEASGRVGGRLWSVELPGLPGGHAELGGMRFHDQLHLVSDLIQHLGLGAQVEDFHFGQPENFTYVRGGRFRQRELTAEALAKHPGVLPYRLRPSEQGRGIAELEAWGVEAALPGFGSLRSRYHAAFDAGRWDEAGALAEEYARSKDGALLDGARLHEQSWWSLLTLVLGQEAIQLLQDTGGYDGLAANGNASDWLDVLFHAPVSGRYRCLTGGFDTLPRALHERFLSAGGTTRPRHLLRRIDRSTAPEGGRAYVLHFECPDRDGQSPRWRRVRARAVMLALPQHALARLDPETFLLQDPGVRHGLESVRGVSAVKLFLAYPFPWWERMGVTKGRSTTDLPLRQLWYWRGTTPESSGPGLLLAAYASGTDAEYWSSLRSGEPFPDAPGGSGPIQLPNVAPASRRMVARAHAMLLELHGVEDAPLPIAARCQDWSTSPHGAAWHVWREHAVSREVIPAMRRPLADEEVFIVSDCWSHDPGSVHGSLGAAECTLQDHLGLAWPSWLRREGTRLGPRDLKARHLPEGGTPWR